MQNVTKKVSIKPSSLSILYADGVADDVLDSLKKQIEDQETGLILTNFPVELLSIELEDDIDSIGTVIEATDLSEKTISGNLLVLLNARDFGDFIRKPFRKELNIEELGGAIEHGIMGVLFGAVVQINKNIPVGKALLI